jgi:hypothetical protein
MVPQVQALNPHQSALLRALNRATVERIVVFHQDAGTLGVATVASGIWTDKPYHISVTGERPQDCRCDCMAARNGRTCKHLATALLARKYGVYAHRPEPQPETATPTSAVCPTCGMDTRDPLHDVFCQG